MLFEFGGREHPDSHQETIQENVDKLNRGLSIFLESRLAGLSVVSGLSVHDRDPHREV